MRGIALAIVSFALIAALVPMSAFAKPGPKSSSPPPEPVSSTVQGTVTAFEYSDKSGQLKGFYIDGATEVKFPPHEAGNVAAIVSEGSQVEVSGDLRTGKHGETHLKAWTITNLDSGQSVTMGSAGPAGPGSAGPPPAPSGTPPAGPPPAPANAELTAVDGTLTSFEYSDKSGHLKGFWMDTANGVVEVKFPHHQADAVTAVVADGSQVQVTGRLHTGPKGDTHLKAETIENQHTGQSVTIY